MKGSGREARECEVKGSGCEARECVVKGSGCEAGEVVWGPVLYTNIFPKARYKHHFGQALGVWDCGRCGYSHARGPNH